MKTIKATEAQELGVYKDTNHISASLQSLAKELGVEYTPEVGLSENNKLAEFNIRNWHDTLVETEDGFWMPAVEFFNLSVLPIKQIVGVGWIDGTHHHLGFAASQGMSSASNHRGYTFWVEYN